MTKYHIKVSDFPPNLHRIIRAWYEWQGISLRKRGRLPGDNPQPPRPWESSEQAFWGARPPEMANETTLILGDDSVGSYFLVHDDDVYYIEEEDRGSRGRYWMFRRLEDAEKCLLFLMSQSARPGKYSDSPRFRWNKEGLNPRVSLRKPDPDNFPGRVCMTIDQEPVDRGWMGENDAIAFSHAITMTYEQLDIELREGIPRDWFTVDVVDE